MTIAIENPIAWIDALGGSSASFEISSHAAVGRDDMEGWGTSLTHLSRPEAEIRRHIERENGQVLMLNIGLQPVHPITSTQRVRWGSTLKVGEGRYVRAHGDCADFPTAFQQVNAHQHASRVIGSLTWWQEGEKDSWVSWIGAARLEAMRMAHGQEGWYFSVHGEAPTLEEAALLASIHG
ncbi:hypothetical protein [Alicycliphilus denitrificans]|uniref:hypothetical protein n=1 Tax=Alicycliphilus denitrificans TaxID=179636 RepID=UPI0011AF36FA|nr:hypothetical protein [Alicycliphilus denitrificans]